MRTIIILLGLTAAAAFADTITFTTLPGNTEFGTYNGFAYANINGYPGQLLVCDDFGHTTFIPSPELQYNVSTLTGENPLEFARFVNSDNLDRSLQRYEQAAVLADGLRNTGPDSLMDLTADYQYALWHLFTSSVKLPDWTAKTLLNDSKEAIKTPGEELLVLFSQLRIYTPKTGYEANQEFLGFVDDASWQPVDPPDTGGLATPEPGVFILAGSGLLMILLKPLVRRLQR